MKRILSLILLISTLVTTCIITGMPAGAAVISWEGRLPYDDIGADAWYTKPVTFCYNNKIMTGINQYTFDPDAQLTRASIAVMFARVVKADVSNFTRANFHDTPAGQWYSQAVAWAVYNSLMKGTGDGYFSPDATVTREQIATVLMRFMKAYGYSVKVNNSALNVYTDGYLTSSWAKEGMIYALSAGLMGSTSTTQKTLEPQTVVTRSQAAQIFMQFMKLFYYGNCDHTYRNATCTTGLTCTKCGIVNSLPKGHSCSKLSCRTGSPCTRCNMYIYYDENVHNFAPATCASPRKCVECGITRGAKSNVHSIVAADCTRPSRCTVCGISAGLPLGHKYTSTGCTAVCQRCGISGNHSFKPATCTTPKTCTKCGATEGYANGHKIVNADCYNPSRCTVCGITSGVPLGHTTNVNVCGAKCSRCGYVNNYQHKFSGASTYLNAPTCTRCGTKGNKLSWKQGYLNNLSYIDSLGDGSAWYYLKDINSDGVPELYQSCSFAAHDRFFTLSDYSVTYIDAGGSGYVAYIPGTGLFTTGGGHMGYYNEEVYQLYNGKFVYYGGGTYGGEYGAPEYYYPGNDFYYWNGKKVTASQYVSSIYSLIDLDRTEYIFDNAKRFQTLSELRRYLNS